MIPIWKDIVDVREVPAPMQVSKPTIIDLYKSYGQTFPNVDFQCFYTWIQE